MSGFIDLSFDHYYDYDELTGALKALVDKKPELANLISIGKSPEGRDIWLVELTNKATGDPGSKPAVWVDGNTHAGEPTGSMVCLKTVYYLLSECGVDRSVSGLLDEVTFYVLPRIDPDGGEFVLKTPYYVLGGESETGGGRWYPFSEEEWRSTQKGLYLEDVDGDGFITSMRVPDACGDWKVSGRDGRLMVRREPGDVEGCFYRVYPEGLLLNYAGGETIEMAPQRWSLNFNRNYPGSWGKEDTDRGNGPYPLSEPETRAVVDFIISHQNICLAVTYHTHGGVCLSSSKNENLSIQDRNVFGMIESIFGDVTGYPSFSMGSRRGPGGTFSGYLSHCQDIPCVTVELWDVLGQAGLGDWVERRGFAAPNINEEDRDLKLLAWNDKNLDGKGFINWTQFEHSQLGNVEIGGWKKKFITRNPPDSFLEDEIDKVLRFPIECSRILPKVEVSDVQINKIDNDLIEVKAVIQNKGALPSYVMKASQETNRNPVSLLLELTGGLVLYDGEKYQEFNLEGYTFPKISEIRSQRSKTGDKYKQIFSWIIKKLSEGTITIRLASNKGGISRKIVDI